MNSLINAIRDQEAFTLNDAKTFATSNSANVDLFFAIGASRGKDITALFDKALDENENLALRILAWARDIRGGAGERQTFRSLAAHYINTKPYSEKFNNLLNKVSEYGRWDDLVFLFSLRSTNYNIIDIFKKELSNTKSLMYKWLPRKGYMAKVFRKAFNQDPKAYRKMLVENTRVVETLMCANKWDIVNYYEVPSVASARYKNAFNKHDSLRYKEYISAVINGTAKMNANAVFPHDVLRSIDNEEATLAQWKSLPNYCDKSSILPMVDVSGSMGCATVSGSLTALDVAVSLGLYVSEKQESVFKNAFLTFSSDPKLEYLSGNIINKLNQMNRSAWEMNTNLVKAFELVLRTALEYSVPQKDFPKYILILSDMEFDIANNNQLTNFEHIKKQFYNNGYDMPKIIFWNLNARAGNVPIKFDANEVCLVSGYSPTILTSILKSEELSPENVMLKTVMVNRYKFF